MTVTGGMVPPSRWAVSGTGPQPRALSHQFDRHCDVSGTAGPPPHKHGLSVRWCATNCSGTERPPLTTQNRRFRKMRKLDCTTDLIQHAIGSEVFGGEEERAPPPTARPPAVESRWRAVREPLEPLESR